MGNCLPFLLNAGADHDDTQHLDQNNQRRHRQHNSNQNDRSNSGNNETGAVSTARRIRSHVSSYVNQLYTASQDYDNDREREAIDEKRKARARAIIDNLRISEYDGGKEDSEEECAICMLDFEKGQLIRFLPCSHSYHCHCIDDWLLRSLTCPSCMEPIDSALLSAFTSSSGIKDIKQIPNKGTPPSGLS